MLAVLFDILALGVGFGWDRTWHATHPFEDLFSPPHLWHVVERPTRRRVLTFVTLAGIAAPAFTGIIDLALRARTP